MEGNIIDNLQYSLEEVQKLQPEQISMVDKQLSIYKLKFLILLLSPIFEDKKNRS